MLQKDNLIYKTMWQKNNPIPKAMWRKHVLKYIRSLKLYMLPFFRNCVSFQTMGIMYVGLKTNGDFH